MPPGRTMGSSSAVAVDREGHVWIAERCGANDCAGSNLDPIMEFDAHGKFIKAWGHLGTEPGCFSIPHSIVCDSKGRLYVADRNNVRIQVFNSEGRLLDVWRDVVVPWGLWLSPQDEIWVCGSSPMVWVNDPKYPKAPLGCPPKDQVLIRFNTAGKLLQLWTFPKAPDGEEQPGTLNWLHGVALDSRGNVPENGGLDRMILYLRRRSSSVKPIVWIPAKLRVKVVAAPD